MTDYWQEHPDEAKKKAEKLEEQGFTDKVDASPEISLYDYGLMRNPDTGETIIAQRYGDKGMEGHVINLTKEEIIDDVKNASEGFFSSIGSSKEKELERIRESPDHLAYIIQSLNMYSGRFNPTYRYRNIEDIVDSKVSLDHEKSEKVS